MCKLALLCLSLTLSSITVCCATAMPACSASAFIEQIIFGMNLSKLDDQELNRLETIIQVLKDLSQLGNSSVRLEAVYNRVVLCKAIVLGKCSSAEEFRSFERVHKAIRQLMGQVGSILSLRISQTSLPSRESIQGLLKDVTRTITYQEATPLNVCTKRKDASDTGCYFCVLHTAIKLMANGTCNGPEGIFKRFGQMDQLSRKK